MSLRIPLIPVPPPPVPRAPEPDVRALAALLRVLSEPNRLRIVHALARSELCACHLEGIVGISASLLAHHLRVLRHAGVVRSRRGERDARWIYYSLDPEAVARAQGLWSGVLPTADLPAAARMGSNQDCG